MIEIFDFYKDYKQEMEYIRIEKEEQERTLIPECVKHRTRFKKTRVYCTKNNKNEQKINNSRVQQAS